MEELKALKSSENKKDVLRKLGYSEFYCIKIKNLYEDSKTFYDWIRKDTFFE